MVRNMRGKPLLALVAVLAVACGGPDPARFEAVLDQLAIPAGWELVHTEVATPDTEDGCSTLFPSCPRVVRYYLVDGEPIDALPEAKETVTAAGFQIEEELGPQCDIPPSSAACVLVAVRDSDLLQVDLYNPGEDTEGLGLADEGRTLIRLTAQPK